MANTFARGSRACGDGGGVAGVGRELRFEAFEFFLVWLLAFLDTSFLELG